MVTSSGAFDAAVEAAAAVIPVDPDDGTCIVGYQPDGIPLWSQPGELARAIIVAALPLIREQIARQIATQPMTVEIGPQGTIYDPLEIARMVGQLRAHYAALVRGGTTGGQP